MNDSLKSCTLLQQITEKRAYIETLQQMINSKVEQQTIVKAQFEHVGLMKRELMEWQNRVREQLKLNQMALKEDVASEHERCHHNGETVICENNNALCVIDESAKQQGHLTPSTHDYTEPDQPLIKAYRYLLSNQPKECISDYSRKFRLIQNLRLRIHRLSIQATTTNTLSDYTSKSSGPILNEQFFKVVGSANQTTPTKQYTIRLNLRELPLTSEDLAQLRRRSGGPRSNQSLSISSKVQSTMSLDDLNLSDVEDEDNDGGIPQPPYNNNLGLSVDASSINGSERSSKLMRKLNRKDPLYYTNRFKFTQAEDQILKDHIQSKTELLVPMDKWKDLQDKHFQQRPIFELVRRCIELSEQQRTNSSGIKDTRLQGKQPIKTEEEESKNSATQCVSWTTEEDEELLQLVSKHGDNNWLEISNYLPGHSSLQCRYRYTKINPLIMKHPWRDPMNDIKLLIGIRMFGERNWAEINEQMFQGRVSELASAERYLNILDPKVLTGEPWSEQEDLLLIDQLKLYPHASVKWSKLSLVFDGTRTDNQCKRRARQLRKLNILDVTSYHLQAQAMNKRRNLKRGRPKLSHKKPIKHEELLPDPAAVVKQQQIKIQPPRAAKKQQKVQQEKQIKKQATKNTKARKALGKRSSNKEQRKYEKTFEIKRVKE